jgi:hypothetical protein
MTAIDPTLPNRVESTLGTKIMKVLYEEVTALRTVWAVTPQQQQQMILDRMQQHIDVALHSGVRAIMAAGFPNLPAKLDTISAKDGVKVTLMIATGNQEALHNLIDAIGKEVTLVLADSKAHQVMVQEFKTQADQPGLPLGDPQ